MKAENKPCTMGVGCDEAGVCYAAAHGQPERCPKNERHAWDDLKEELRVRRT
jgi:hypothetical protein